METSSNDSVVAASRGHGAGYGGGCGCGGHGHGHGAGHGHDGGEGCGCGGHGHGHGGQAGGGCGCGGHSGAARGGADSSVTATLTEELEVTEELDPRALPDARRHEIILAKLDALRVGQALVIVAPHDPAPMREQAALIWPGRFAWTCLQAGPDTWRFAVAPVG